MKKINFKSGLTLIELPIVITIIGIITSVVLTNLNISRNRAYDSKIQQQLASFRSAAEIWFNNQEPNTYGVTSNCDNMFSDVNQNDGQPGVYIDPANLPPGIQPVVCQSNQSAYAVKISSVATNGYWCADSKGALKLVSGAIGGPVTVCPP